MKAPQALACVTLLAAGCGMRVIGELGDGNALGDSPAGAGGAVNASGGVNASGAVNASGGVNASGATSAAVVSGSASTLPVAGSGGVGGTLSPVTGGSGGTGATAVAGSGTAVNAGAGGQGGTDASSGAAGEAGQPADLPPPLTAVPVAHLKLDECAGPALDTESSASAARYNLGCSEGVLGKAAWFSAAASDMGSRRVELADAPRFAFTEQLTVAAWVLPQVGPQLLQAIVAKWYSLDMFQLALRYVSDGHGNLSPRFSFTIAEPEGDWGRPAEVIAPTEVDFQHWTHVAGVYRWSADGQVGHITLYINGQPVAETSTKIGTLGLQQSSRPVMIGYAEDGAQFVGSIDEVRLYDVALGPELAWLFLDPAHP